MPTSLPQPVRARSCIVVLAAVAALACSSREGTSGAGGGAQSTSSSGASSTTSSASATTSGSGGAPPADCPPPAGFGGSGPQLVPLIGATVTDVGGVPIADLEIQLCGLNLCINGTTNAAGSVVITATHPLDKPALKFGDALGYPKLAVPITEAVMNFPKLVTAKLPAGGAALAAGTKPSSGGVTLAIPPGGQVTVDELTYDTPDKQAFRAVAIDAASDGEVFAPTTMAFDMLFGVAPIETTFCPAVKVTVPNGPGWQAGTAVEFWVLGVDTGQVYAPYGGWAKMSDGQVSADGKTVETAAGQGFVALESFAVRKKP